jgi:hypothetical protein
MQPTHHVLIVADRGADPAPLVEALRMRAESERIEASVLVPAGGAAQRHAALLQVALLNAGVMRCDAHVGDPDPHAAIDDALRVQQFDEVLVRVGTPELANVTHLHPGRERRRAGRAGRAIARVSRYPGGRFASTLCGAHRTR